MSSSTWAPAEAESGLKHLEDTGRGSHSESPATAGHPSARLAVSIPMFPHDRIPCRTLLPATFTARLPFGGISERTGHPIRDAVRTLLPVGSGVMALSGPDGAESDVRTAAGSRTFPRPVRTLLPLRLGCWIRSFLRDATKCVCVRETVGLCFRLSGKIRGPRSRFPCTFKLGRLDPVYPRPCGLYFRAWRLEDRYS